MCRQWGKGLDMRGRDGALQIQGRDQDSRPHRWAHIGWKGVSKCKHEASKVPDQDL